MKKLFVISSLLLLFQLLQAQEPTKRNHVTFDSGDIVISNTGRTSDGELSKTAEAYSPLVVGVFSEATAQSNVPRILTDGIAYVKFDPTNGNVVPGDHITTSAKTGYGMKATRSGFVIGVVLESTANSKGLLKIRVQPAWISK